MTTKVNFPKAGMGIDEGIVRSWLKGLDDPVKRDEPIAEIETAKAVQEILAPCSGRLCQILAAEGDTVMVNTAIALIDDEQA